MFYTYMHTRNDTGEIFYVGKGKKRRPYDKSNRNRWWWHVVNKAGGYEVSVLSTFDTEQEALDHEVFLIQTLKDMGVKLSNIAIGGKGTAGFRHTEEAKKKMSETRKGFKACLGYKHTDEAKANMAAAQKGRKHSEETKKKMSLRHSGPNNAMWGNPCLWKRRAVICTTTNTRYDSLTAAAEATGTDTGKVTLVCQGKRKSTKGFSFKYDDS